ESNARLLSALTNNIDEASEFHEEEKVYQIRELVKDLIYALLTDHEARYLFLQQKWFPLLANRKDQELGLDILLLSLRDMLYFQVDLEDIMLCFDTGDELLKRDVMGLYKEKLLLMNKAVMETKQKLKQNIHPTLVMEQLVLKFSRWVMMIGVIGVRFKPVGTIYYFDPNGCSRETDEEVIVEPARGSDSGQVVIAKGPA